MAWESVLGTVQRYYSEKLRVHGPTPAGVDWNSTESQRLRFDLLLQLCDASTPFSLIDYGCGYGALADELARRGWPCDFTGFDISPDMVRVAREKHSERSDCRFTASRGELVAADYAVASGVLNVKLETSIPEWEEYVFSVLDELNALSTRGFAFNVLSNRADPERMRSDLYYADPCRLLAYCQQKFSRRVALLHDSPLYEFTVLVRKNVEPRP